MKDVIGLPDLQLDTVLIVSRIVEESVKSQRDDVVIVDKTIRNSDGQIIGCTAFAKI